MTVEKAPPREDQQRKQVVTGETAVALAVSAPAVLDVSPVKALERPIWEGRPSLLLAIPNCVKWAVILGVGVGLVHGWTPFGFPWGWSLPARPDWIAAWLTDWRLWALFPLWRIVDTVAELACMRYELTADHLRISTGIFSRWTDEQELYRVKKIVLWEPGLLRWAGRSELLLYTADPRVQQVALRGIRHGRRVRQILHDLVERVREKHRVHGGESI